MLCHGQSKTIFLVRLISKNDLSQVAEIMEINKATYNNLK